MLFNVYITKTVRPFSHTAGGLSEEAAVYNRGGGSIFWLWSTEEGFTNSAEICCMNFLFLVWIQDIVPVFSSDVMSHG